MLNDFAPWVYPVGWLVIAVMLGVAEAATVQLVAIWFALGAAAAIVPALLGAPLWVQILVFVVVSAVAMLLTRPFLLRMLPTKRQHTNADRVIGETGIVELATENNHAQGRVLAMGLSWSAVSENGEALTQGERVTVTAIDGVKLIVKKEAVPVGAVKESL